MDEFICKKRFVDIDGDTKKERRATMTVLVVGASGATGRLLVKQLLQRGLKVKVIVRSPDKLPAEIRSHENLSVIQAAVLDLTDAEMAQHVQRCDAVASCLGHNLTLKGIYGPPRLLVTETTRRLCNAIKANKPDKPVRFVLMNTTGNSNRDLPERVSLGQTCVIGLIRLVLPPQRDNEQAADYLRVQIGPNDSAIEWAAVRPDTLIDESAVSEYAVYASPIRSAIFDPGKTSRINVGHFMAELMTDDALWHKWKGQMPVIYNKASS
jgi:NAD(P)H-binding